MKRKLVSMLLVLVMLISLFPAMLTSANTAVLYHDLTGGWVAGVTDGGTKGTVSDGTYQIAVGEGVGYNSNRALYVKWTSSENNKDWLNIANDGIKSYTATDRYTISFYIKHLNGNTTYPDVMFGYTGGKNRLAYDASKNGVDGYYAVSQPDANGWQYVTASTIADAAVNFTLNIQKPSFEAYIDNFVVTKNGESTNLLLNGDFETWAPTYLTATAPATTKGLEEWTATASGSSITTRTFVTSVGAENAYSGTQSMYVEFVADNYGKNWVNISNTGTQMASLDANKSYTVSMYVKGNKLSSAAMLMGYLYDDKNDVDTRNYQMLSRMSATEPEDAEKAIDGWRKYTAVLNNPTVGFTINIQCEAKVYIDDVSVVEVGGDGTNLVNNPGFEGTPVWEPSYPDVSAPTTTKALEEWTATTSGSSITTRTFVTSVGAENAYSGTQSMYVEFVADNYGKNWVNISNTGTQMASLDANKSYTVSMYVKGNKLSSAAMLMGYLYDDKNDVDTRNYQMLSRMSATEPEDAEKAIDGWRKYTAVLNNPTVGFTINIQCEAKVYIDDVSVVEVGGDGTNLVNNPGFEGGPVILPDITETALDTSKWVIRTGSIGTGSYTAGVTAMEAQHGKRSLHVTWSDTGSGYVLIQSQTATALLTEGETYTLEAYIKRVSGNASVIGGWYNWGGQGVGNSTAGEWSALTASGVYTSTNSPRTVQIVLQGTAGVDMYVDNMVLKNASGVVIWSEDFETATTGYEVSAIKLFDEDMNEITALGSELNGKTATGAVAVTNYDDADLTGQLLIALYDGYQLKELIMSEVERISTTANGATIIRVEFEMPEYKDSYTMKAFIWDDIEKMNPLSRTVAQF